MRYQLIPSLDVAKIGTQHYLFDRHAKDEPVHYVPTQSISLRLYRVIRRIRQEWPGGEPQALDTIKRLFEQPSEQKSVALLVSAGYLQNVPGQSDAKILKTLDNGLEHEAREVDFSSELEYFKNNSLKHYFRTPSFFHLPRGIANDEVDVGLVGIPVSSVSFSVGTTHAADSLRHHSQKAGFWFDFYKDGIYSEMSCAGSLPEIWCKGVVAKDYGDIGKESRTVGELFQEIDGFITNRLIPYGIRTLFVGGDHAITFPIVHSMLRHAPDLVLIHLDAHNDLFYTSNVEYNHAGPIHGLLLHSMLSKVLSFGLHTSVDARGVDRFEHLNAGLDLADRTCMHSLQSTRRLLSAPDVLKRHLKDQLGDSKRPVYLTIDLDVLDARAVAGQLSTPAGHGLQFPELFELVQIILETTNVVGADLVEFNVEGRSATVGEDDGGEREIVILIMQLLHGLNAANSRNPLPISTDSITESAAEAPQRTALPTLPRGLAKHRRACTFDQQIPRRSLESMSYDEFLHEHVIPGLPVLLVDHNQSLTERWNIAYFQERIARDEEVCVNIFTTPFADEPTRSAPIKLWEALALMRQRDSINLGPMDERYYIVDWEFGQRVPELLADYEVPSWFNMDLSEQLGLNQTALQWIYFGEEGTGSSSHTDVLDSSAWLLLACGRKHWRMVKAEDAERLQFRYQSANLFDIDTTIFRDSADVCGFEVVQEPGEILWTPPRCLHAVRNLDRTIALTHNYVDLTNIEHVFPAISTSIRRDSSNSVGESLPKIIERGRQLLHSNGFGRSEETLLGRLQPMLRNLHAHADRFAADVAVMPDLLIES